MELPAVQESLQVADGSIIPTALGLDWVLVHPYLTIGAWSERIAGHLVNGPAPVHLFG